MQVRRYDLCDGRYVLHLLERGETIGKANIYRDHFAGSPHTWRIDYFGLAKHKRGVGKGVSALGAVIVEIGRIDAAAKFIIAEALGKNILRLLVAVIGSPVFIASQSGKVLTLAEASAQLPAAAREYANGAVSGPRVFLAFNMPVQ